MIYKHNSGRKRRPLRGPKVVEKGDLESKSGGGQNEKLTKTEKVSTKKKSPTQHAFPIGKEGG